MAAIVHHRGEITAAIINAQRCLELVAEHGSLARHAARIDGCGEFGIFWSVVRSQLGPAMGTLRLITFISSWNNFVAPLVVTRSAEHCTVLLALRSMQSPDNTEWGALMMGSAIAMLPLSIVFAFSAKRLVAGLTSGAVKG